MERAGSSGAHEQVQHRVNEDAKIIQAAEGSKTEQEETGVRGRESRSPEDHASGFSLSMNQTGFREFLSIREETPGQNLDPLERLYRSADCEMPWETSVWAFLLRRPAP